MSYNAVVDTLNGFFKIMVHDDDRQYVPRVKAPTLLISSCLGKEVPTATALYLRQNLQQDKLVEVPDADIFNRTKTTYMNSKAGLKINSEAIFINPWCIG